MTGEMFTDLGGTLVAAVNAPSVGRGPERHLAALSKKNPYGSLTIDGDTFRPEYDKTRLTGQLKRVRDLMSDGKWRTLSEIAEITGDQTQAISARLRDLRKPRFGSLTVNRRRRGVRELGLFEYNLETGVKEIKEP